MPFGRLSLSNVNKKWIATESITTECHYHHTFMYGVICGVVPAQPERDFGNLWTLKWNIFYLFLSPGIFGAKVPINVFAVIRTTYMASARPIRKLENVHFWFLIKGEVIVTHELKIWTYLVSFTRAKPLLFEGNAHNWFCTEKIEICTEKLIERESEGTNNGPRVCVCFVRSNHYSNSRIE